MCGRYAFTAKDAKKVKTRFSLKTIPSPLKPRYNIAPSTDVPVILNDSPDQLQYIRWGLLPSWSKTSINPYTMINARSETILEKRTYKSCFQKRRCLVLADSFYEWKKAKDSKIPYRIFLKTEEPFAFAGLWDHWEKEGQKILSCSIITTLSNKFMEGIHDRMPVILSPSAEKKWLSDTKEDELLNLLKPFPENQMKAYPISTQVNSPKNDNAEIFEPV